MATAADPSCDRGQAAPSLGNRSGAARPHPTGSAGQGMVPRVVAVAVVGGVAKGLESSSG